jgi:hypothetical protein
LSAAASISSTRWRENWRALTTAGAVHVELPRSAAGRRRSVDAVRALDSGTPVVVSARAPRALARCRSFAADAGLQLDRRFLAFPSASEPAYLVEEAPATVRVFLANMLVTPPRARAVLRRLGSAPVVGLLAPGRVIVGRRV